MRIESKPFELNPGFEAEGKQITHAIVRLLTNTERQNLENAVNQQSVSKIKNRASANPQTVMVTAAMGLDEAALDPFIKAQVWQQTYDRAFFTESVSAFLADDGTRIDDPATIKRYCGLLIETDEEAIVFQREELRRSFRHSNLRAKHKCPNCDADVDCA